MENAILRTLAYSNLFDFPLNKEELWKWLIWDIHFPDSPSRNIFEKELSQLVNSHRCGLKENYYFLPGREKIIGLRKQKEEYSSKKIEKAQAVSKLLAQIPWIKLIGVSGSLAKLNAGREDDIDFFLITSRNRLWLTRGLVVVILLLLRNYRRPGKVRDMICPNMLVAETNLEISPQNIYLAYEVCSIKPMIDKDRAYAKFITSNLWVKKYLPNLPVIEKYLGRKKTKGFVGFDVLELFARKIQLRYMRARITSETVADNLIKFHPDDVGKKILSEFNRRVKIHSI